MEALQEDKLIRPQVHHSDGFDPTWAANLNYRHKHPGDRSGHWDMSLEKSNL